MAGQIASLIIPSDCKFSDVTKCLPTYKKYGGPDWCGGVRLKKGEECDFRVPAGDSLDALFKQHDWDYTQAAGKWNESSLKLNADINLGLGIVNLMTNPAEWAKLDVSGKLYSVDALNAFTIKIIGYDAK